MTAVAACVPPGATPPAHAAGDAGVPCSACLRRSWLIASLAGRIEHARRCAATRLPLLLALADEELMRALGAGPGTVRRYGSFDRACALGEVDAAGLVAVCRHDPRYPGALRQLPDAPAVLYVAGDPQRFVAATAPDQPAVAIVGARRPSSYGLEVARGLARGLGAADVTVVSGMALGIDAAAHAGALDASGPTVAVLAGGAERAYPPSKRRLHAAIRARGCVVSEMPPGSSARRWCFPARNRLIAALARLTIVVEAMERSGSLITAELARDLGRDVGAVPGQVVSPLARGSNALLADGAHVICAAADALDIACGVGAWQRRRAPRAPVPERLRALHAAVGEGAQTPDLLAERGFPVHQAMTALTELELHGHVRRTVGGRYVPSLPDGDGP